MKEDTKSFNEVWEVSIVELKEKNILKYKVTRRLPNMSVAETKVFNHKEDAKKQFEEWIK